MHSPIIIDQLELILPHKICFRDFSTLVNAGDRIAIIGRNGSGKTTLLKMLFERNSSHIEIPANCYMGYVPQITALDSLSGGESFQEYFSTILRKNPNLLLLDEPTNHLDARNRQNLLRRLSHYQGSMIVVSHDEELLHRHFNTFWHIHEEFIYIFKGNYTDYLALLNQNEAERIENRRQIKQEKRANHERLMREQERASKSRKQGEKMAMQGRWSPIIANQNRINAEHFTGNKLAIIREKERSLDDLLASEFQPKLELPRFFINAKSSADSTLVTIKNGSIQFEGDSVSLISNIYFSIKTGERVAIHGNNGSGKTTLIQAILKSAALIEKPELIIDGEWYSISSSEIGYLDQHYHMLDEEKTVLQTIENHVPDLSHDAIRDFLNGFLFRKNEEVYAVINMLSGGEKARLCLALITLLHPALLILDEITNNLDLETKQYVIQVLNNYHGAIIAISHDPIFLELIQIETFYEINKKNLLIVLMN